MCRKARADYVKAYRESPDTDLLQGDPRHGRRSTYVMRNCRCPLCTKANNDYYHDKKARQALCASNA